MMVHARYSSRASWNGWGGGKAYAVARARGHTPLTQRDKDLLKLLWELYEQLDAEIGEEFYGVTTRMLYSEMERVNFKARGMPRQLLPLGEERKGKGRQRSRVAEWLRQMESRGLTAVEGSQGKELGWGLTKKGLMVTG